MKFPVELVEGTLVRRYKRFLADVTLADGTEVVAHCPNPGRMTTCAYPGGKVLLSPAQNPKRKLKWTWEIAYAGEVAILVNTSRPNAIVGEALAAKQVPGLEKYTQIRSEVRYGSEKSRIDFLLQGEGLPDAYVEVKSVSLLDSPGLASFPDAKTDRGAKHLRELTEMLKSGHRSVMIFLLSRGDATRIRPADNIDPNYGKELRAAAAAGVELIGLRGVITPEGVTVSGTVPIELPSLPAA